MEITEDLISRLTPNQMFQVIWDTYRSLRDSARIRKDSNPEYYACAEGMANQMREQILGKLNHYKIPKRDFSDFHDMITKEDFDNLRGTDGEKVYPYGVWYNQHAGPSMIFRNRFIDGANYWMITYTNITGFGRYYFIGDDYDNLFPLAMIPNHLALDPYYEYFNKKM